MKMGICGKGFLIGVLLLLPLIGSAASPDEDIADFQFDLYAQPDLAVWSAVMAGFTNYRTRFNRYSAAMTVVTDESEGTIETNWFPEHKGEVKIRVQIAVWGDSFRVDALQKTGVVFTAEERTDWSQSVERKIHELIEIELAGMRAKAK